MTAARDDGGQAEYDECVARERAADDGEGLLSPEDWCEDLRPDDQ